jgi:hypothetical protein
LGWNGFPEGDAGFFGMRGGGAGRVFLEQEK